MDSASNLCSVFAGFLLCFGNAFFLPRPGKSFLWVVPIDAGRGGCQTVSSWPWNFSAETSGSQYAREGVSVVTIDARAADDGELLLERTTQLLLPHSRAERQQAPWT